MTSVVTEEILQFANKLADCARTISITHFRNGGGFEIKSDDTPVTKADRDIEHELKRRIAEKYPDHGIVGEEEGVSNPEAHVVWVIDPIDGTQAFISGSPTFGTLIALVYAGLPALGILEIPVLLERWVGAVGWGTQKYGLGCCRTSSEQNLANTIMYATSPFMFSKSQHQRFEILARKIRFTRFGTDCYAYGLLASGYIHLVAEADMKPHDYMSLLPVVEQAGGVITDWSGEPLQLTSGTSTVLAAANSSLHRQALAVLNMT